VASGNAFDLGFEAAAFGTDGATFGFEAAAFGTDVAGLDAPSVFASVVFASVVFGFARFGFGFAAAAFFTRVVMPGSPAGASRP